MPGFSALSLKLKSFRSQVIALFLLTGLLCVIPVYAYLHHIFTEQLQSDRVKALNELAVSVSAVLGENLHEREREISFLAEIASREVSAGRELDLQASIDRLQKSHPYYSWIGFADTNGTVKQATGGMLTGQSVIKRPWFQHGMKGPFVGDLHEAVLLAKLLPQAAGVGPVRFIDFAAPVTDQQPRLVGVLAAHAHWVWAEEVMKVLTPGSAGERGLSLFIVNSENQIIYPDQQFGETVAIGQQTSHYAVQEDANGRAVAMAWAPVKQSALQTPMGWKVLVRQPVDAMLSDVLVLQNVFMYTVIAGVLVFIGLGVLIARRISEPIEAITDGALAIAAGNETATLRVRGRTLEIRRLSGAIQSMASHLIQRNHAIAEANSELEARVAARTSELAQANHALEQLARRDALTGIANRLAVNERLQQEQVRTQRYHQPFSVLMLDVDHFKRVNDTYGHAAGDEVLKLIAGLMQQQIRASDFCGRMGGEEFLVLLPDTAHHEAMLVAEKLRLAVQHAATPIEQNITISVGVASDDGKFLSAQDLLQLADARLYEAKRRGRNQVMGENSGQGELPGTTDVL